MLLWTTKDTAARCKVLNCQVLSCQNTGRQTVSQWTYRCWGVEHSRQSAALHRHHTSLCTPATCLWSTCAYHNAKQLRYAAKTRIRWVNWLSSHFNHRFSIEWSMTCLGILLATFALPYPFANSFFFVAINQFFSPSSPCGILQSLQPTQLWVCRALK